jgi:hypothetical protein
LELFIANKLFQALEHPRLADKEKGDEFKGYGQPRL